MTKHPRNPDDVHPPLAAYVHQMELRGSEQLLVMSGQVGVRADGSVPDDAADQLDVALDNVERNLAAAGMATGDLVKLTLYLVGEMDPVRRRDVLAQRLDGHTPCMTLVIVVALAAPHLKVEVDAWASRSDNSQSPP